MNACANANPNPNAMTAHGNRSRSPSLSSRSGTTTSTRTRTTSTSITPADDCEYEYEYYSGANAETNKVKDVAINDGNDDEREDDNGNYNDNKYDNSPNGPIVAIVGAGFAGLVLANCLESRSKRQQPQPQTNTNQHPKKGAAAAAAMRTNQQSNRNSNNTNDSSCCCWKYKLFESKPSSGIPVIGTIRLESAKHVLEELGLFEEARNRKKEPLVFPNQTPTVTASATNTNTNTNANMNANSKNDNIYNEVSRESFLELLRRNVKIQSSSRVVDIVECGIRGNTNQDPKYTIVTKGSDNDDNNNNIDGDDERLVEHGPFDYVILSHGLALGKSSVTERAAFSKQIQATKTFSSSGKIIRIGDCRYHCNRAWWEIDFFGAARRKRGADVAIRDGLQVGEGLLQLLHDDASSSLSSSSNKNKQQQHQLLGGSKLRQKSVRNNNKNLILSEILSLSSFFEWNVTLDGKLFFHQKQPMHIFVVALLPIMMAFILYCYH